MMLFILAINAESCLDSVGEDVISLSLTLNSKQSLPSIELTFTRQIDLARGLEAGQEAPLIQNS